MSVLASIDLQTLGDAFGLGAIYALMAVGIGLVFGVLRLGLAARRRTYIGDPFGPAFELFPILSEFRGRQAGALSGGQQQQLAIGRALVSRPDLLLLDEPSLGLAPLAVDGIFKAFTEIREVGTTILLVEQRAQRTVALANRTHVLVGGELRMTLGPADADDTEKIIAAYLAS